MNCEELSEKKWKTKNKSTKHKKYKICLKNI